MLLGSLKNRGRGGGVLHQPRGWGMGQRSISISVAARLRPPALCVALQLPDTWYQAGPALTGIRVFERTVKQSRLEPPHPVSPDCQAEEGHGSLLPQPLGILKGQGQGTSKEHLWMSQGRGSS